jgi:phenylacetate-CoA ligase
MKVFYSIDTLPPAEIEDIQGAFLAEAVQYAYYRSPYYRKRFDALRLVPPVIKKLVRIEDLPLTDRLDFQGNNWAFLATPQRDIVEIVSTTGTTGDPAFVALTKGDLDRLALNEERSFGYAGVEHGDVFHLAVTCDNLFIAGIAYYLGIMRRGASVVRVGPQHTIRHLDLMRRLKPTGIVAVPSFMVQMYRRMDENGVSPRDLGLKKIVLIGDSIRNADFTTNALGRLIERAYYGSMIYSTYGITEAQTSFCECDKYHGLHSHPDFVVVEIVDDTGAPLPDGEEGELVLTPLQIEGMPLLRYRTGDITFKVSEPCPCGRNSVRIGPILGRKYHRLKVKGVTLYPKAIENAVLGIDEVVNYQIEVATGDDETDILTLRVGSYRDDQGFAAALCNTIRAKTRVTPNVEIERPEEIEKRLFEGGCRKPITLKDMRLIQHG